MMKKIRTLQVGCGSICNAWLSVLKDEPDIEICALVDINEKAASDIRGKYGFDCDIFTDLKIALNAKSPDLVIDNTLPGAHFTVVTTALEYGCHVFGEKPMADSFENAVKMVKTAEKSKKEYFVMQNYRYNRNIRSFTDILKSGLIGDPGFISADFFMGPHFHGFRDIMDSPLILDMAIHTFDSARMITGCDPVSVYCHEFDPPGSWYKGCSSACCIFEMTNHLVFSYNGSWNFFNMS